MNEELALSRALDQLHAAGRAHWIDNDGQGRANHILAGLKHRQLLDRQLVLDDMRARGHDDRSPDRLAKMIDSLDVLLKPGPRPRVGPFR